MMRCGYCWAEAPAGQLCTKDWEELQSLLRRCDGIDGDLASAVGRRGRHGETVARSTERGLPINMDAVDARRDLTGALQSAVVALLGPFPALTASGAAALLLGHPGRLLASYVAPSLLGDLAVMVRRAVDVTDKPRGRLTVSVPCPRCGAGPLRPVQGALQCTSCRELMTVGEVRRGAA